MLALPDKGLVIKFELDDNGEPTPVTLSVFGLSKSDGGIRDSRAELK